MCDLVSQLAHGSEGQVVLTGDALRLHRLLDATLFGLVSEHTPQEYLFPPTIPVRTLERTRYFHSFPHVPVFPVSLDDEKESLRAFAKREGCASDGSIELPKLAKVHDVLTPAACYHVYALLEAASLEAPAYITTSATCFRTEVGYAPLARQRSFTMREVVCVGSSAEVQAFLATGRARLEAFAARIGLPVELVPATDPFFDPYTNPRFYAQRMSPQKTEIVFGERLAIGSINFHKTFFGESFAIDRAGTPASSGCIAFGIERWMLALFERFGTDLEGFPDALLHALGLGHGRAA